MREKHSWLAEKVRLTRQVGSSQDPTPLDELSVGLDHTIDNSHAAAPVSLTTLIALEERQGAQAAAPSTPFVGMGHPASPNMKEYTLGIPVHSLTLNQSSSKIVWTHIQHHSTLNPNAQYMFRHGVEVNPK